MKKYKVEWAEREIVVSYYCEDFEVEDDEEMTDQYAIDIINDGCWDRADSDYENIPVELHESFPPFSITAITDISLSEKDKLKNSLRLITQAISDKEVWIMNNNMKIEQLRKEKEELELKLNPIVN